MPRPIAERWATSRFLSINQLDVSAQRRSARPMKGHFASVEISS
jgi:hypothetical protein